MPQDQDTGDKQARSLAFQLTPVQERAWGLIAGQARHVLLVGGSRSGKTFVAIRALVMRALMAPGSRHVILRFRFAHVKNTVVLDTFPKVMRLCFPDIPYHLDKSDWYVKFPNNAEIWFGGLDDKDRSDKILGAEYVTVFLNECSQISISARDTVISRLAQLCHNRATGKPMRLKVLYDCNPPSKSHWTYKLFIQKFKPGTNVTIDKPENYDWVLMNPSDNLVNLPPDYIEELNNLPAHKRARFLEGKFADLVAGNLWDISLIDKYRIVNTDHDALPKMKRIVVGVDPSGAGDEDNKNNDAIGIVVAGIDDNGKAYTLEDCTVKAGPATWGQAAVDAYHRHEADVIVAEKNYGGEMVRYVINSIDPHVKCDLVTATRGKAVRAEPISALTEQGKIMFVGQFEDLEEELCAMTTDGYKGGASPNRADAFIWAMSYLFPLKASSIGVWKVLGGGSRHA